MDNNFDRVTRTLASTSSRRQALKLMGGGLIGGAAMATGFKGAAAAKKTSGVLSFPVSFVSDLGSFVGSFDVTRFAVEDGQVVAVGTLTGTVTNLLTGVTETITQALSLPLLDSSSGTCEILDLVLGPLDLTLLGLRVELSQVELRITAQQGGGVLGDLLCAVADLLNGGGNANALTKLLNQVLKLLGSV